MVRIYTVYGRKCPIFETFTVRFRIVNDAVLIDLGVVKNNINFLTLTLQKMMKQRLYVMKVF
jgi:hypothetical protein